MVSNVSCNHLKRICYRKNYIYWFFKRIDGIWQNGNYHERPAYNTRNMTLGTLPKSVERFLINAPIWKRLNYSNSKADLTKKILTRINGAKLYTLGFLSLKNVTCCNLVKTSIINHIILRQRYKMIKDAILGTSLSTVVQFRGVTGKIQ